MNKGSFYHVKKIVLIGLLAATVTGGKLALSAIPNVEIVTLLIILYTVVFGLTVSLPVTIVFVSAEMLIYGINTWVISYYIYWCALALVAAGVKLIFKEKLLPYVITTAVMTAFFGVLTTFVDSLFMIGASSQGFFESFSIIYLRGAIYFVIHIVSNTIVVALLFLPLKTVLFKLKRAYFGADKLKTPADNSEETQVTLKDCVNIK